MTPPADQTPGRTLRATLRLRHYFFTGLATLFPAMVTLYLLLFLFNFVDGILGKYINAYWQRAYGYEIPGLGLVITILLILLAGWLSSHFFGQWMFRSIEGWLGRLPIVRRIYQPVKQLAEFLFTKAQQESAFRRVVFVQYPRPGAYSIAFVTNETTTVATGTPRILLTLLIPNPPSPFTGPIIFVPKEDVITLSMSVEEAVKLVVSGGIVAPQIQPAVARPAGGGSA